MGRKNAAHDAVVESLTQALLQMMEEKPLAQINISELCCKAEVGRVSFYRNFDSLDDILVQYLKKCTDDWWADFSQKETEDFYACFWPELLEQYRLNGHLIRLLYQNNVSHLIKEHIFACCHSESGASEEEGYTRAALAGALYGLVDEWIKRGMGDFPTGFSFRSIANVMPK